jgi:hypothetical protein
VRGCKPHGQPPSWKATPYCLSTTAYSIYLQLTSISGGRSSIRNPRTRHAVGTGTPRNMVLNRHFIYNSDCCVVISCHFLRLWLVFSIDCWLIRYYLTILEATHFQFFAVTTPWTEVVCPDFCALNMCVFPVFYCKRFKYGEVDGHTVTDKLTQIIY